MVDGIRPYTWEIWRRLPFDSKQRFLRHARAWWEVHRHRMAPEVDAEIQAGARLGPAPHHRRQDARVSFRRASGARITYRRRGSGRARALDVAKVAECTGVYTDPLATTNPVLQQLHSRKGWRGQIRSASASTSMPIAPSSTKLGAPRAVLYGVGPLTRAAFWEIMAVPDIRVQCAELAAHLRGAAGRTTGAGKTQGHRRSGMIRPARRESKAIANLDQIDRE